MDLKLRVNNMVVNTRLADYRDQSRQLTIIERVWSDHTTRADKAIPTMKARLKAPLMIFGSLPSTQTKLTTRALRFPMGRITYRWVRATI